MKRKNIRTAGMALLVVIALLMAACSSKNSGTGSTSSPAPTTAPNAAETEAPPAKLSANPITYKWMAAERKEAPIKQDWQIFKEIEEKTNVKLEFEAVPDAYEEKQQILIATNSVPDFMFVPNSDARLFGADGVFLNLNDYLHLAPNIQAYFEEYPEAKALVTGADGGIYGVPVFEGLGFNFSWLVRDDVMKEHGLTHPTNPEEFYQLLKQLKELYPDSYPLINERDVHHGPESVFTALLRSFSGLEGFIPFDPASEQYVFAAEHPGFQETLAFMNKLYDEKLLDPEFSIIKAAQWEERMLSGKSLVTYFWKTRVQALNNAADTAGVIPGYEINAMPQFTAPGIQNYQFSRDVVGGTAPAISSKVKDPETAVKFLDYLMGEEGSNYLAYGIEGEIYEWKDGEAKYLESLGPAPYTFLRENGVFYPYINLNMSKSRLAEVLSPTQQGIEDMYMPHVIPTKPLVLSDEENEVQKAKLDSLRSYMNQKISEFIAGRNPINDDTIQAFIEQCIKLGAHELRDVYNASYQRTYGG